MLLYSQGNRKRTIPGISGRLLLKISHLKNLGILRPVFYLIFYNLTTNIFKVGLYPRNWRFKLGSNGKGGTWNYFELLQIS